MKVNKKIAVLLIFTLIFSACVCCFVHADSNEQITLDVKILNPAEYYSSNQNFKTIDLRSIANRDLKDEISGDHKGGWSDQGDNDMRMFPYKGITEFLGIPFDFIDPSANDGKAVVGVRGQNDTGLPTKVSVPVNDTAAGVYFFHSSPYASGICGQYIFKYSDGTSAYMDIQANKHINDFWNNSSSDFCRVVYTGQNAQTSSASASLFALNNPHPEKEIKSIDIETTGNGAFIMLMAVTLTDKGPFLPLLVDEKLNPDQTGWIEYNGTDINKIRGSLLDNSSVLDAPAGKHGSLSKDGKNFVFSDGTKAKFWGTNIVGDACFPEKDVAAEIASSLSMMGINLVRMSELFNNDKGSLIIGGEMNSDMADKLCYLISELKAKGIYTYLAFTPEENGIINFVDNQCVRSQKERITSVLSFFNPYTETKIGLDSSLAMVEFIDSQSAFMYGNVDYKNGIGEKVNVLFNEFLKEKYKSDSTLKASWGNDYGADSNQSLDEMNFTFTPGWSTSAFSTNKSEDMYEFLAELQNNYYSQLVGSVKEINPELLCTCNSNPFDVMYEADALANSSTDFVARNVMWTNPSSYFDKMISPAILGTSKSMLADDKLGYFNKLFSSRISDIPYVVSGWNTSVTNTYCNEGFLMMSAIAAGQGWVPVQYSYLQHGGDEKYQNDFYSFNSNPAARALMLIGSKIYFGIDEFEKELKCSNISGKYHDFKSINNVYLSDKLTKQFSVTTDVSDANKFKSRIDHKEIKNDSLYFNKNNAVFAVKSKTVNAVCCPSSFDVKLPYADIKSENSYSAYALVSCDNQGIEDSHKLLLVAAGRTYNSGEIINSDDTILDVGSSPVMTEPVKATIKLKVKGKYRVYVLDTNGQRIGEIHTFEDKGYESFAINDEICGIYYEIEKVTGDIK